jgi:serine/threonine protein kinase
MAYTGSYLGFYGALWDGNRVRVEPLTPIFDMSIHWREKRARHAIASALDALMAAVASIEAHYKSIQAEAKTNATSVENNSLLQKTRGFPFMTSYEDDAGQRVAFTYNERLDDEKLIFSAILHHPNSGECLVKYTWRYSEAAHNYLASHGSAPRIRRCVRISADWTAVIMDKSTYQRLYGLRLSDAEQEKVRRKVRSVVQTLHQGGFVHGDIRDTNILVDIGSLASEDVAIHLIDFDWAGRLGEAKYPIEVNKTTMRRPVEVEGGGLITKEHDLKMVSYLFT